MCNQIDEKRLSNKNKNNKNMEVKVRCWGGCNIAEMFGKLEPIMDETHFDTIIVNVGTNDSTSRTSDEMISDMIELKQNILTYFYFGRAPARTA